MAKALGVSPSYVNLLENNQRSLSIPLLARLSDAYGIEWRDLLDDDASLASSPISGTSSRIRCSATRSRTCRS